MVDAGTPFDQQNRSLCAVDSVKANAVPGVGRSTSWTSKSLMVCAKVLPGSNEVGPATTAVALANRRLRGVSRRQVLTTPL